MTIYNLDQTDKQKLESFTKFITRYHTLEEMTIQGIIPDLTVLHEFWTFVDKGRRRRNQINNLFHFTATEELGKLKSFNLYVQNQYKIENVTCQVEFSAIGIYIRTAIKCFEFLMGLTEDVDLFSNLSKNFDKCPHFEFTVLTPKSSPSKIVGKITKYEFEDFIKGELTEDDINYCIKDMENGKNIMTRLTLDEAINCYVTWAS
jgi:hypothetical protein